MVAIDSFKQEIGAVASANRYKIVLPNLKYFANIGRGYQFLSRDVTVPGQSIKELFINPWGFQRTLARGLDYDDFPVTFLCDHGLQIRQAFCSWHDDIYDKDGLFVRYYDDYVHEMQIQILNRKQETVHTITVIDAWPKDIQPMQLSFDAESTPIEFTVSFSFWDLSYS